VEKARSGPERNQENGEKERPEKSDHAGIAGGRHQDVPVMVDAVHFILLQTGWHETLI
jgi:hypothetical protein